jgi:cardiolipin synthase
MGSTAIVGLVVLGLVLGALALVGALQSTRGTPVNRVSPADAGDRIPASHPAFGTMVGLLTQTTLLPGNRVDVLADGDATYPRLWADLRAATRSISLQTYYAQPGRMADELAEILAERARAGVEVRLLYDGLGAMPLHADYFRALRAAGVQAAAFRPLRWNAPHEAQHRSHARIVVVDGRVAYAGGFGIADKWYGDGHRPDEWRDTNVRCAGPVARQFQAAFAAGWAEATGELLMHLHLFPDLDGAPAAARDEDGGSACAGLLFGRPTVGSTSVERFLAATITSATARLYITNAYFAPDDDIRRFLIAAARRGVDVRVLTAGDRSDVFVARYAGRARYEELLAGGVRIYEYLPTMVHAKTLVADGVWSTVGSLNLDNRGLALNDEALLVTNDPAVGRSLERLFAEDLRCSREIDLQEFRRRPLRQRAIESVVNVLSRWI